MNNKILTLILFCSLFVITLSTQLVDDEKFIKCFEGIRKLNSSELIVFTSKIEKNVNLFLGIQDYEDGLDTFVKTFLKHPSIQIGLFKDKASRKVQRFWDPLKTEFSVIQANVATCRKVDLMWEYSLLHNLRRKESNEFIFKKLLSTLGLVRSGSSKINDGLSMGLQILKKYKEQTGLKIKSVLTEAYSLIKEDSSAKTTAVFKTINLILSHLDNYDFDSVLRDKSINIKERMTEYVSWVDQSSILPKVIKTKMIDCLHTLHRSAEYLEDSSNKAIEASQLVTSYTTTALKVTGALSIIGPTFDVLKAGYSLMLDFLEPSDFKEQLEILERLSIGRINSLINRSTCKELIVKIYEIIHVKDEGSLQELADTCWPRRIISEHQKTGQNMLGLIIKELILIQ